MVGSPFSSKVKASLALEIVKKSIDNLLDTGKAVGVKGYYLYSRQLKDREIY